MEGPTYAPYLMDPSVKYGASLELVYTITTDNDTEDTEKNSKTPFIITQSTRHAIHSLKLTISSHKNTVSNQYIYQTVDVLLASKRDQDLVSYKRE